MVSQPQTTSLSELAEVLTGDQTALVDAEAPAGPLRQVGAAVLPEPFPMPVPGADDPVHPVGGEPVIELFQVDERGRCEAAGPSEAARAWWWPQAQALVDRVLAALIPLGVVLE